MQNIPLTQRQLAAIRNALMAMDDFYYDELKAAAPGSEAFTTMENEATDTQSALYVIEAAIGDHTTRLAESLAAARH